MKPFLLPLLLRALRETLKSQEANASTQGAGGSEGSPQPSRHRNGDCGGTKMLAHPRGGHPAPQPTTCPCRKSPLLHSRPRLRDMAG